MSHPFSTKDFRDALGLFATGIAIATTTAADGPVGITVNSFASVSLNPPLVLFSASRTLRSFDAFRRSEGFTINVLCSSQQELSSRFARPGEDKWKGVPTRPGRHGGVLIAGCLAAFDCKLHRAYDGGDHVIFLGEVVHLRRDSEEEPLLYFRSGYRQLAFDRATLAVAA